VVTAASGSLALPEGELPDWATVQSEPICIGVWQGRPLMAAALRLETVIQEPFVAETFNFASDTLDDVTLTLGGMAKQILHWEWHSCHCSRCGGTLEQIPASWGKSCAACRSEHFPHIHPCIIVLVRRGDEFLLVRKPEWALGRYSLIAGFLDFGESLEECVQREVREETGLEVANIRYVGSQSWPFPSQMMAGFVAEYASGELQVDGEELEDAQWFCRQLLPESLPGRRSIARWIIDKYALGDA